MKVEDLFNSLEKRENWAFLIYVDGIQNNILAFCNSYYGVEGTKNKGDGFFDYPYSVKDLFQHKVVSFYPCANSLSVKIATWEGMKHKE